MSSARWIPLKEAERRERSGSPREESSKLHFLDLAALGAMPAPPQQWIVEGLIPSRNVTLLSGDGGAGKSRLALQLQASTALHKAWVGLDVIPCRSLGIYAEDDPDELHRRLAAVATHLKIGLSELDGLVRVSSRVGLPCEFIAYRNALDPGHPTDFFGEVLEQVLSFGPKLVILDSLHDFFAGNEISRPQARRFIALCRQIAIAIDGAVVVNAHPSQSGLQSGTGTAGSTAWNNAVRSRLYLSRPDDADGDPDLRTLSTKKANYARIGGDLSLRWQDGVFVRDRQEVSAAISVEAEVLSFLDKARWQGFFPSNSKQSSHYAPKILRQVGCRRSEGALEAAIERLFGSGDLEIASVKDHQRKWREVVQRAGQEPEG